MKNLIVIFLLAACHFAIAEETTVPVTPATKGASIKVDGRIFAGFFASEAEGAYRSRSFDVPDAKLRFTFNATKNISIVNRFSNPRGTSGGFDYFYVDIKDFEGLLPGHSLRLGKFKADVGQETWSDNPVENILISNSAPVVSGYDEGLQVFGRVIGDEKLNYSVALVNGTKDFSNSADGFALLAKLSGQPIEKLFVSATYYSAGNLNRDTLTLESDLKIGGLQKAPAGAKEWGRSLWEVDVRWCYGNKGISPNIGKDSYEPYMLAFGFGQFTDVVEPSVVKERKGSYWLAEGIFNATSSIFAAGRISSIKLDDDYRDKLAGSPVNVNEYQRLSIGVGYRISPLVVFKVEGSQNNAKGTASGTPEPELNQLAAGLAIKF